MKTMRKVEPSELRMRLFEDGTIRPVGCSCKCPGCPSLSFGNPIPDADAEVRDKTSPTYHSYRGMKTRVFNPNHDSYKYYGARGVNICLFWIYKFRYFVRDMGARPSGTTLDRIDTDGDYTPYNCKWSDLKTQAINRRNSRKREQITPKYTFDKETKSRDDEMILCYREDIEMLKDLVHSLILVIKNTIDLEPR